MTGRQRVYFDAIKDYIKANKCSPSYEDIGKLVGAKSVASVFKIVSKLVEQGYLVRDPHLGARNLHLIPDKLDGFNLCNRNHEPIYFQSSVCPMCTLLQQVNPPREIRLHL